MGAGDSLPAPRRDPAGWPSGASFRLAEKRQLGADWPLAASPVPARSPASPWSVLPTEIARPG